MRRPLVVIFLSFSMGCILMWYGQDQRETLLCFVMLLGLGLVGMTLRLERERSSAVLIVILAVVCGMISMNAELHRPEPLLNRIGQEATITGVVVKEKETDYGINLLIRPISDGLFEKISRRRIWVSVDAKSPEGYPEGWILQMTGTVKAPGFPRNPGGFDQKTYLRTLGVQVVMQVQGDHVTVLEASTKLSAKFRSLLERSWTPVMGEKNCGGLMGLLFGTSDSMEEGTLEAFQSIGLGHLLAVSGLHVGLVYGAVQTFLGKRGRTVLAQLVCCAAAILYAGLAGFSASATRAALMIVIHSIGRMLFRPYDMVTSASVAGMVILMGQPCQIMSSGFQLSMLAAFGISCVLPRLSYAAEQLADRKRSHVLRWAADHVVPVIAIQLVMGPICARRFQCVSLWSLGLNPLCIAAAGLLIPMALGLACVTVMLEAAGSLEVVSLLNPLFMILIQLTGGVMSGMMNLGEWAATLPGTFLTGGLAPGGMILYYLALFTWSSETFYLLLRGHHNRMIVAWILSGIFVAHFFPWWTGASTGPWLWAYQDYPVVVLDVGQGDCIHIQTPKGKNILIDGGGSARKNVGKETLLPYLLHRGVSSIDLALATHLHQDHFQGLAELSEEMRIHQLGIYEANRYRQEEILQKMNGSKLVYLKQGSRITLEPNIWIDVLAPPERSPEEYEMLVKDDSDENDSCLVFLVHYQGLELLVTGDLGMEGERQLLERGVDVKTDLLKIGHHGSKYSTSEEFLRAAGPEVAAISVGTNYFGHPSERVIELLKKNSIIIGRTDLQGALIVKTIRRGHADIISGNGELTWRIDLRENK
ncbi:MAG: DNA internalization-related competence protein ComEC/Rec2 [Firmicutes bacterium]|nr:DNA internalization-related competence protein ComEC/Rec2 [Bacillota bacterium]